MENTNTSDSQNENDTQNKPLDEESESIDSSKSFLSNKNDSIGPVENSKLNLILKLAQNIKENNDKLLELLSLYSSDPDSKIAIGQLGEIVDRPSEPGQEQAGKIIEGVFDGENMIGPDGKSYSMPANYASKSKLVEGDILKLTITNSGAFVYKQIGPIERRRIVGVLQKSNGGFVVESDNKTWKVLTASVTYFKGAQNDEVIILIPKNGDSAWAAVDNIVKSID